ncbi:MAG: sulfotransferase family 2 domain-containing protein [Cyanobium sp.]
MIICHSRQFIFLHGRKTAGSSIGTSLNRFLADGDASMGYVGACRDAGITPPDWAQRWHHLKPWDLRRRKPGYAAYKRLARERHGLTSTHMSAAAVKALVGDKIWHTYFKFTFERHPLDRLVSFYHWRLHKNPNPPSFEQFLAAIETKDSNFLSQHNLSEFSNLESHSIDGNACLDMVGRFEQLHEDLSEIAAHLSLNWDGWLPNEKKGIKPKQASADLWAGNSDLRSRAVVLLQQEADLLGYCL